MIVSPAILLLSLSLTAIPPEAPCTPYLLFAPKFTVSELTQLGPLPIVGGEYLMEEYAKRVFEDQFSKVYNACLYPLSEKIMINSEANKEFLALLRRIILSVTTHSRSSDDFFEERHPDFRLNAPFQIKTVPSRNFKYGLVYSLTQYYFTDAPTRWIKGGEYSQGFILSMCIVNITNGDIEHCRVYHAPDETLLHRAGYFEKDEFFKIAKDTLTSSRYLVYKKSSS